MLYFCKKPLVEFEYIAAPMNVVGNDELSLTTLVQAKVIQEYVMKLAP